MHNLGPLTAQSAMACRTAKARLEAETERHANGRAGATESPVTGSRSPADHAHAGLLSRRTGMRMMAGVVDATRRPLPVCAIPIAATPLPERRGPKNRSARTMTAKRRHFLPTCIARRTIPRYRSRSAGSGAQTRQIRWRPVLLSGSTQPKASASFNPIRAALTFSCTSAPSSDRACAICRTARRSATRWSPTSVRENPRLNS